ncbi:MAG TPA: VCBS repeat-containing protein [Steroidobacteraceae bacterium]|nr:VCBS repeat-containing protein [Steroidobacteraceae bacterium]
MKKSIAAAILAAAGSANAQDLFRPAIQFPTDATTTGVAVGDVTGDGRNDIVTDGHAARRAVTSRHESRPTGA